MWNKSFDNRLPLRFSATPQGNPRKTNHKAAAQTARERTFPPIHSAHHNNKLYEQNFL
jgi:hypothetical protein